MNRPTRRTPQASWQIGVDMATTAVPRKLHSTDVDMGSGMVYERRTDRLRLETGPGAILTITPGRRFAEALARGFAAMPDLPATSGGENATCVHCGQAVRVFESVNGHRVPLNPKPTPNGVWMIVADDRVRLLQPMEEPTAATYAEHYCREGQGR